MRMEEMKKSFWGYQKESVHHCIAALEEEASQKIREAEEKATAQETRVSARIKELEQMVKDLQRENEELRRDQNIVYSTMAEAQKYVEKLKEETAAHERKVMDKFDAEAEKQWAELEAYREKISQVRELLISLLKDMNLEVEKAEQDVKAAAAVAPVINLSLFQRKSKTNDEENLL